MSKLLLLPPDVCVLSRLCADLSTLDRATLARCAVILPTRRLVTFCLAVLAQRHTAFEPPLLTTLDGFLARQGAVEHYPLSDELQIEQILSMLLTTGTYKYLRPAYAHEIRQFFNDLVAADIHEHFHTRMQQQLATNPWLAEGEIEQQRAKYAELERLFVQLQEQLQRDRRTTRGLARHTELQVAASSRYDFEHIYVAAFTSVSKSAADFLRKFAAQHDVTFYFNHVVIDNHIHPLAELINALQLARPARVPAAVTAARDISIWSFASPQVEITYALYHAQQLLQTGKVRAAEIAIVLSSEHFYAPHLFAVVDFFTFAKNIAVPVPLRMTTVGSFLQALSSYGQEEFQVPAAIDLIGHPCFATDLPRASIISILSNTHVRGRGKLQAVLAAGTPAARAVAEIEALSRRFRRSPWRTQLLRLHELLHELRFLSLAAQENFERQSVEDVFAFLRDLAASSLSALQSEPQEFWQFVSEKFLSLPLRKVGEPLAGVQILGLTEVRAMPFQHVLVVGCNEGFFPQALPGDVVVSDKLKTAIGLNGWQQLEAMEDITFNSLLQRRVQLTCSYCSATAASSRFIERVRRTHTVQEKNYETLALQDLLPVAPVATTTAITAPAVLPRAAFFSQVSASSTENFIRCPLRYLWHKLGLAAATSEVRDSTSPREEGNHLHAIIEKFSTAPAYAAICREVTDQRAKTAQLTALLNDITAAHAPFLISNDTKLATHLRFFAWPRLAAFISAKTVAGDYHELNEYEINLQDEQHEFTSVSCVLNCKIDHIHEDPHQLLLLDYKRKSLPEKKELDVAIAMQLAFYAYAVDCERRAAGQSSRLAETVIAYYSILDGELSIVACGAKITADCWRDFPYLRKDAKARRLETLVAKMHALLAFRHANVQQHQLDAADPSFCGGCRLDDFCRKNDPAVQEQIATQNYLQQYIDAEAAADSES